MASSTKSLVSKLKKACDSGKPARVAECCCEVLTCAVKEASSKAPVKSSKASQVSDEQWDDCRSALVEFKAEAAQPTGVPAKVGAGPFIQLILPILIEAILKWLDSRRQNNGG
jgi:hypothetical protein